MSQNMTRRELLAHAGRGAGLVGLGGAVVYLARKAGAADIWQIDPAKCIDIRLGATGVPVCENCATTCVLPLSAVRAVNDHAKCGRCCMCPAYFDVTSEVGDDGLPTLKLCPRDAIRRTAIGKVDPDDPLNNFYEYTIDETLCNGCGRCVMNCKEPAGLGSIRLEVRNNLCLNCNRCSISEACPESAYLREPARRAGRTDAST
jgi:Na+-translocating ferredoxin:NAD+ oxidoreductase subunit B